MAKAKKVEEEKEEKKETKKETKKEKTSEHNVEVKIDNEEWKKALDKTFKEKNKKITIPGFRKGHAPYEIYIKNYGIESLYLDAADSLANTAFFKMLKESKLEPIMPAEYSIKDVNENEIVYNFNVLTEPEVNIKKYKDLKIKKEKAKVTKDEIKENIDKLLDKYTELVVKEEGELENGNIAIIDFEGSKDGKLFEGGSATNHQLEIGSGQFIPGFEEQLIGMKKGETKTITVTFPEDYHAQDLAGQEVQFKVTLNSIKEKEKRELDEELFEDLNIEGVNSKETLEKYVENEIKEHKQHHLDEDFENSILDEIAKNTEVDVPQKYIDYRLSEHLKKTDENFRRQYGIDLNNYLKLAKKTIEELKNEMEPQVHNDIIKKFIIDKLIEIEKLEASDKEIEDRIKEFDMTKDQVIEEYGTLDIIGQEVKINKLMDKLEEYNK